MPGEHVGTQFYDGPVYKTIEGAAYTLGSHPNPELDAYLRDLIGVIAAAQEPDGYLYTARTIDPGHASAGAGPERWSNLKQSHELFLAGHLYEAAVAYYQATGRRTLLDVAVRNAGLVTRVFGPEGRPDVPGHEEIELALVRLAHATGDNKYLEQARRFVEGRGRYRGRAPGTTPPNPESSQDHAPVLEQTSAVGHAVRAMYLYTATADLAQAGLLEYKDACDRIWDNVVRKKTYLTGGVGAHPQGEAFGADYELPNDTAYAETCASVGNVFWNHRMFLRTGDGRYVDVLERTLYNGLLAGVSIDGQEFFYPNVLASDGKTPFNMGTATRQPWFQVACCPTNIVRFLPALPGYIYAWRDNQLYVALYIAGRAAVPLAGGPVEIEQAGGYPWEGRMEIRVNPRRLLDFVLKVRIPGWAAGLPMPGDLYRYLDTGGAAAPIRVNGKAVTNRAAAGFVAIERKWRRGDRVQLDFPIRIRRVVSHQAVAANRGRVALERGPLVYCFEGADNGGSLAGLRLPDDATLRTGPLPGVAGGVTAIHAGRATAVPYFAWSHRGPGEMAVWVPRG